MIVQDWNRYLAASGFTFLKSELSRHSSAHNRAVSADFDFSTTPSYLRCLIVRSASSLTIFLLLMWGPSVSSQESPSELMPVTPIAIEQGYLHGRGLTRVDPSEFDGDNLTRDEDFTSDSYTHHFYTGKIFVAVYEAGPGRVYIDGAPFDEFVQILEGRLILTPDGGEPVEFKQGESLVVPRGYRGYWYMPEKYRELIVINTGYAQTEGGP